MEEIEMEENGFLAYSNALIKTARLEKLEGKYCGLVATNGFTYQGVVLSVEGDDVIFMDRKVGRRVFNRNGIFVCYELPEGTRRKHKGGK
jgi:hypothetical protein